MNIKEQIFAELTSLETAAEKLHSSADVASRQTDLEVAILTKQVTNLRDKNARAAKMISETINILKTLK